MKNLLKIYVNFRDRLVQQIHIRELRNGFLVDDVYCKDKKELVTTLENILKNL